ncbi:MAG: class I SAM-dependent methyltransferase [Methylophilus sp.]|nr:class I SAM-dependent methyltransferase [Methylophilus sp.]
MTSEELRPNDYRKIAYQRYGNFGACNYSSFENYYRRKLIGRLSIGQDWRCLDLACGFGNFLSFLRQAGVQSYTGIDASAEATAMARQEFGESHVILKDVFEYLALNNEQFDLISALDFVEHVGKNDVYKLLTLVSDRQPLDGLLLIRTPNANGLFGSAARYGDITHEVCFTPDSLGDVLSRCGYTVQAVWEDGPAIGTLKQTLHWMIWQVARFCIRLVNAAETGSLGDGVLTRNMWVLAKRCDVYER